MARTWPGLHFEFHGHNDYGLAAANCMAAAQAGARGVHTSVNSMGERAGNSNLVEVVACLHDHTPFRTGIREEKLVALSEMVVAFSGKAIGSNSPIVGRDVFTQTAGIHADGDSKGGLYANKLAPERFGRRRSYALGKLSGKASLDQNLRSLGIELPQHHRDLVLARIIELGDRKHTVTPEDLPMIIADVLKTPEAQQMRIESYEVRSASGAPPHARLRLRHAGKTAEAESSGDGGYDALMKALEKAALEHGLGLPALVDYTVRIPPGGKSEALVETVITWRASEDSPPFSTIGVDPDQLAAAIIATEKMLNVVLARASGT
jgi:D-citramalate synthase